MYCVSFIVAGDGDPVDVLELGGRTAVTGEVYPVRILGALAMLDDAAVDWKIITLRDDDQMADWLYGEESHIRFKFLTLFSSVLTHMLFQQNPGGLRSIVPCQSPTHRHARIADVSQIIPTVDLAKSSAEDASVVGESLAAPRTAPSTALPGIAVAATTPAVQATAGQLRKLLDDIVVFFRDYKIPEGKPANTFAYGANYLDAAAAIEIVRQHHMHWCVVARAAAGSSDAAVAARAGRYDTTCRKSLSGPLLRAVDAAAESGITVPEGVWM